jgi:Zn-dependent peptidase ImmA (M78 family)
MNFILSSLARYGLNHRGYTESEFLDICSIEDITYFETPEKYSFWACIDGESHIVVSRRWKGQKKLFIQLHELGHHFLHGGDRIDQVHFFDSNSRKHEFEAHAFATIAMCPINALLDGTFEVTDRFTDYIKRERENLWFLYKY